MSVVGGGGECECEWGHLDDGYTFFTTRSATKPATWLAGDGRVF